MRKLDALVAKTLGCDLTRWGKEHWTCGCPDQVHGHVTRDWSEIKSYSTDIRAAWELVEKLPEWCFDIVGTASYTATFRRDFLNESPRFSSKQETAPLAICLAFLRAKAVPQSEIDEALIAK